MKEQARRTRNVRQDARRDRQGRPYFSHNQISSRSLSAACTSLFPSAVTSTTRLLRLLCYIRQPPRISIRCLIKPFFSERTSQVTHNTTPTPPLSPARGIFLLTRPCTQTRHPYPASCCFVSLLCRGVGLHERHFTQFDVGRCVSHSRI